MITKESFTDFEKVREILEKNDFFGFTCKRKNGRLTYTYKSIRHHCVKISVVTAKLQPTEIQSPKIVLNISVNGRNLDGFNEFINTMNNLGSIHKKEFPKTFKNLDNEHSKKHWYHKHHSRGDQFRDRSRGTDERNVQMVREEIRKERREGNNQTNNKRS